MNAIEMMHVPTVAAQWRSFAAMAFPEATPDRLKALETAFFSGAKALQRMQDGLADASRAGLPDDEATAWMEKWRGEIETFGRRRAAELGVPIGDVPIEPVPDTSTAAGDEKLQGILAYAKAISGALAPMIVSGGNAGMVAIRAFYIVRQLDGTLSGSHTGLTFDARDGEQLKEQIPILLLGEADYVEREAIKQPKKN
jgi:hypothetical protein